MQGWFPSLEIVFSHHVVQLVHENIEGVLEWTYVFQGPWEKPTLASDYPP